jgi:predicted dehydrogenase
MSKTLRVGLIGYKFMGKAHSNAWRQVNHFFPELPAKVELTAICGRDPKAVEARPRHFRLGTGGDRLAQNRGRAGY